MLYQPLEAQWSLYVRHVEPSQVLRSAHAVSLCGPENKQHSYFLSPRPNVQSVTKIHISVQVSNTAIPIINFKICTKSASHPTWLNFRHDLAPDNQTQSKYSAFSLCHSAKVKVNFALEQAVKAQRRSRCVALFFL
jgi:hypothetical protein